MLGWRQLAIGYLRRGLTAAMLAAAGLAAGIATLVLLMMALHQWLGQSLAPWATSLAVAAASLFACVVLLAAAALTIVPYRTGQGGLRPSKTAASTDMTGLAATVQDVARRSPKLSLLAAVLFGMAVGRDPTLLRTLAEFARPRHDGPP